MLSLTLLGNSATTLDGRVITHFRSAKARGLLLFLALEADRAHSRESLFGMFWGEHTERQARHDLTQALLYLKNALGKETLERIIHISRASLQFRLSTETSVDAHEFLRLLQECETHPHRSIETCAACVARLERAMALYQGELLSGFFLDDCPAFDEWLLVRREHYQRLAIGALTGITAHYEQQGQAKYNETVKAARRQVEIEPWREEPYRVLMRTLAAMGQTDAALAEYHTLTKLLRQELGLDPSAETNSLYKHLRDRTQPLNTANPTPHTSAAQLPPTNLPLSLTPLVGRETELAELSDKIVDPDCRLLTLVGQGGIGKTRLSIQTAHAHRTAFPHGAYFVDLAAVDSPDLIPNAIADAMQLQLQGAGSPADQILTELRAVPRPLLLVLDNFEQLLAPAVSAPADSTRLVANILQRAPNVTLLVTSRERLNLTGEWLYQVEGLSTLNILPAHLPPDWDAPEAVQFLLQCLARVGVTPAAWNDEEKRATIRITQLVEGMPLAIELAAAWGRTLTPIGIANEIERGLDIFHAARRDTPARHASIRAVFERSWELLRPAEQEVMARLALFRGGMTREAAREIAGASLEILSALVDKSLIKRTVGGRFRLHELVRQFAAEKLQARHEMEQTQAHYSAYYLQRVAERAPAFNAAGAEQLLLELRFELDNLRQAWRTAITQQNYALATSALYGLVSFYNGSALAQTGLEQLGFAADALATQTDPAARALYSSVLGYSARLETTITRHDEAIELARRAIELGSAAQNVEAVTLAYVYWGYALRRQGKYAAAREILAQAIDHARSAHLAQWESEALTYMGGTYWNESAYADARRYWYDALEICRATQNLRGESFLNNNLGIMAQELGDLNGARQHFQEALRLCKLVGTDWLWGAVMANVGLLEIEQGAYDAASNYLNQALHFFRELTNTWGETMMLFGMGQVSAQLGDYERALTQLRTAAQNLGAVHAKTDHSRALGVLAVVHANLGQRAQAHTAAQQAVTIAREIQDRFTLGKALLILGNLHLDDKALDNAHDAFTQALDLYTRLGLAALIGQAHAGLGMVAFLRGQSEDARAHIENVYQWFSQHPSEGLDEPLRVYWTAYEILNDLSDPRAAKILELSHTLLQTRAQAISDFTQRKSFLERDPWNKKIREAFHK